jgi:hypothetical protein
MVLNDGPLLPISDRSYNAVMDTVSTQHLAMLTGSLSRQIERQSNSAKAKEEAEQNLLQSTAPQSS